MLRLGWFKVRVSVLEEFFLLSYIHFILFVKETVVEIVMTLLGVFF